MCGIVGAVAERHVEQILIEGLKRLEYRGYDSAGIAVINDDNQIDRIRALGTVQSLVDVLAVQPVSGTTGIAHTRWATHGKPSEVNAHPQMSHDDIAVVHNGIIENHDQLRDDLISQGYNFVSQTDTEVVAHLLHALCKQTGDELKAVQVLSQKLKGAYALGIVFKSQPGRLIALRHGSPLVVGLGIGESFIASDQLALQPVTQKFCYLENGDIVDLHGAEVAIYDQDLKPVERSSEIIESSQDATDLGQHRHYMQKEIFEQPTALADTLEGRIVGGRVSLDNFGPKGVEVFQKIEGIQIVACGTSYHAGMVAKYWFEEIVGIPCAVEVASEFRYRRQPVRPNTLFVSISQSGETADTLAALRDIKGYLATLTVCNVPQSSLVRESDFAFLTRAGAEIGVASTKAFTTQLGALFMFVIALAEHKGVASDQLDAMVAELVALPAQVEKLLAFDGAIELLSQKLSNKNHALFLGRGVHYPIALEGALKLKEISYIHAEAYPAGELKHGPLALVDHDMPVITIAPNDALLEKLKSNIEEVQARGGELIIFADDSIQLKAVEGVTVLALPITTKYLSPIVHTIPLQLLSYHAAVIKGTDVDKPRNLAKSVTVE